MNRLLTAAATLAFTSGLAIAGGACCAGDKTAADAAACADKGAAAGCCDKAAAACADDMLGAMRKLEGRWESADANNDGKADQTVTYKATAGGTVIVETLFPGEPHEMVTTYHKDGDRLVATHYCMMGNQPRLRSTDESGAGKFVFAFDGGANVNATEGDYMGALTFEILSDDQVKSTWTHFVKGKAGDQVSFELKRVSAKATATAN